MKFCKENENLLYRGNLPGEQNWYKTQAELCHKGDCSICIRQFDSRFNCRRNWDLIPNAKKCTYCGNICEENYTESNTPPGNIQCQSCYSDEMQQIGLWSPENKEQLNSKTWCYRVGQIEIDNYFIVYFSKKEKCLYTQDVQTYEFKVVEESENWTTEENFPHVCRTIWGDKVKFYD